MSTDPVHGVHSGWNKDQPAVRPMLNAKVMKKLALMQHLMVNARFCF